MTAKKLISRRLGGERGWMQISKQSIQDLLNSMVPEILQVQAQQQDWKKVNEAMGGELDQEIMEDLGWREQTKSGLLP